METLYFAFGVLTMVLLAVASLAVYSTVRVLKLKNRIEEVLRYTHDETNNIYQNVNRVEDRVTRELHEINDHYHRNLDELRSYTDRRFDKLIDTYLSVKETEKKSKQIING
jgi:monoamine oxidase